MPRILRIINRFNLGGPTFNVAYLTRYLPPDFETLLIGGMKDSTEDSSEFILQQLGITPVIIPEMKRELDPTADIIAYRKIKTIIKEFKPDIVHTHASKAGTIGRLAAIRCNVPVILHTFHGHVFHSYFSSYKTRIFQNIEKGLASKCSCIVAISEKQKEELSDVFHIANREKIEVIPLGFNLDRFNQEKEKKRKEFRTRYRIEDDELVISIIGRLVPIKNHNLFLEGLHHVLNYSDKKIRAFIVGDGESRNLIEEKACQLGIDFTDSTRSDKTATLTFTSWIKQVDPVYAGSDIITLTSLNEGTPVSLIEAQASGKPIVSTRVGGIENIVIEGETALLAENNNIRDYSEKLLALVENKELRAKMACNGWENVKNKFHYTRLVDDMARLYYQLLKNHN